MLVRCWVQCNGFLQAKGMSSCCPSWGRGIVGAPSFAHSTAVVWPQYWLGQKAMHEARTRLKNWWQRGFSQGCPGLDADAREVLDAMQWVSPSQGDAQVLRQQEVVAWLLYPASPIRQLLCDHNARHCVSLSGSSNHLGGYVGPMLGCMGAMFGPCWGYVWPCHPCWAEVGPC